VIFRNGGIIGTTGDDTRAWRFASTAEQEGKKVILPPRTEFEVVNATEMDGTAML